MTMTTNHTHTTDADDCCTECGEIICPAYGEVVDFAGGYWHHMPAGTVCSHHRMAIASLTIDLTAGVLGLLADLPLSGTDKAAVLRHVADKIEAP